MTRHANIALFVPHIGCKLRCSFCDQNAITGQQTLPQPQDVISAVETAMRSPKYDPKTTEIAFFGGSFTAIDPEYRRSLLQAAEPFVKRGDVCGIRISTRPDAINEEILSECKHYGVTAIELGAQSMDDAVLSLNQRGHSVQDVRRACELIRAEGFELGLQMMTGLYGDTDETALETAEQIIRLSPDTVRIYPTIVLQGTYLAKLVQQGVYRPQTVGEAVSLCAKLLERFFEADIPVIRLGLHSIDTDRYIAGPWHPAFSELCYAKIYLARAFDLLNESGSYILYVAPSAVSQMIGQKRENLKILSDHGFRCKVVADPNLKKYEIRTERQ
ncbi:MAG: radical SAM protein [Clostridia bacterium]|nr:radical SAM protein [Clostridia bacterium]